MTSATPAPASVGASHDPKPWLKSYPPGVPAAIDEARLGTIADLFRDEDADARVA